MKYKLDCHMHTIASGHAYSTLKEYIDYAKEIGLELIAVTDHTPEMPGSTHIFYFHNLKIIPDVINGIRILKGAEVNIMNETGEIDMEEDCQQAMDLIIASVHPPCFGIDTIEEVTDTYINVMKNPNITIIGHPDDGRYKMDYDRLVKAAKEYNVLLELNNSSLKPTSFRMNSEENYKEMLKYCMQYEVPIIIGSDSHFYATLGDFEYADVLLKEVDFPDELIMNISTEKFLKYLEDKRNN